VPVTVLDVARRPELMIWDGEGAKGGAGYKGFGSGGQSPLEVAPGQGRLGAGLRARLGGGNGANVGWNWHSWASDDAGTDLSGFAAITLWVRFTGAAAPQKVVMRLSCSPREPARRTVDIELVARQPGLMDGAWHQVMVPLAELAPQGHNFDRAKAWEVSFDISSTANMEGSIDIDEIGAVRSLVAPPPVLAPTWKVVRAINLGGEATEVDGVRFTSQRQAEAEGVTPVGTNQPGPWLDELAWTRATNANGEVRRNRNWANKALTIDGKVYAHGLGTHAASEVVYALDGKYSGFTAVVGMDDDANSGEAIFQVWVDGQKAWDSGAMRKGAAKPLALPLVGRKELRLVVDPSGGNDWDHADWGNAQLFVAGGNDGTLQILAGRKTAAAFSPKPAVDPKARLLLGTALAGTKEGLSFKVKVPNGLMRVWLWLGESGTANSRQFDLTVEGTTMQAVGSYPTGGWEKVGPFDVTVTDGTVDVSATALKGIPQVMGILIEQPTSLAIIADNFENTPVGQKAQRAVTNEDANVPSATVRVTEDTAASGKRSLKISDAPGQQNDWDPLLYYEPKLSTGMIECRFAMRVEAGIQVVHEWRGGGADPTRPGPSLRIDGDGRLSVQDKELLRVPVGQWFTVAVTAGLGPQANGRWTLAVTLPGAKEPQRFSDLMCHGEFRSLDWVGFISYAKQTAVYYLDDVEVGPAR
jgi:NPCBM/NEW2 domain